MPSSLSALDVNERYTHQSMHTCVREISSILCLLPRFSGLREREVIGKALQSATSKAFTKYAAELEEIKTNYDKQKVNL